MMIKETEKMSEITDKYLKNEKNYSRNLEVRTKENALF